MHLSTLYKLDKINLWHRRLGHFNINPIKNKLLKINIKSKCLICSQSKQRNLPHRKSNNRAKAPFELIHMDLMGPVVEIKRSNTYMLNKFNNFNNFSYYKENSHRQIDNSSKINYKNISSYNEDKTNDTTIELN